MPGKKLLEYNIYSIKLMIKSTRQIQVLGEVKEVNEKKDNKML